MDFFKNSFYYLKKSIMFPDHKFDNLFRLVCLAKLRLATPSFAKHPNLLTQAMGNLRTKKGALTPSEARPSSDPTTIDASSLDTIFNLSKSLKDGSFRFKPI
jgi:hypothetical protein